jgi:hypothetical protein
LQYWHSLLGDAVKLTANGNVHFSFGIPCTTSFRTEFETEMQDAGMRWLSASMDRNLWAKWIGGFVFIMSVTYLDDAEEPL